MQSLKRIIDLSTSLGPETRLFPGITPIGREQEKSHAQHGVQVSRVGITVHSGTHMDAPLHFLSDGSDINDAPLEQVCGRARVLDLKWLEPGSGISAPDFEQADPGLEPGDIAIINSGYEYYADPEAYCWIKPDGAQWLVERGIKCLAMDLLSIDPIKRSGGKAGAHSHPAHHILLGAGIYLVECLVNLDALPEGPLFFICLPLKFTGCEASPARAVVMEFE